MALKSTPRIVLASIASLLLVFLLNTCGLEQYYIQLNSPISLGKVSDVLLFEKTTNNSEPEFTGFDLYYKFFDPGATPDLDGIIQFEDLEDKHFRRIHKSDDDGTLSPPLIYVQVNDRIPGGSPPDNDDFKVAVDFSSTEDPFPQIYGDDTANVDFSEIDHADIRRDVFDGSEYKQFSEFSDDDPDLTSAMKTTVGAGEPLVYIYIVFYVVSVGYDVFNLRYLHSAPVLLGIIQRDFPYL